jgi:hypothetical protein
VRRRLFWRWGLHVCALDATDRAVGAPLGRIHVTTPLGHLAVAFVRDDWFLGRRTDTASPFMAEWVWTTRARDNWSRRNHPPIGLNRAERRAWYAARSAP